MSEKWRDEKRQDFGWKVEGTRYIKAFWLPEVVFVDPKSRINGYIGVSTADILINKIASYSNEVTVTHDFITALSVGGFVQAFGISSELGGGYLIVLAASVMDFHTIGLEYPSNPGQIEELRRIYSKHKKRFWQFWRK